MAVIDKIPFNPTSKDSEGVLAKFVPQYSPDYFTQTETYGEFKIHLKGPVLKVTDLDSVCRGMRSASASTDRTFQYFKDHTGSFIDWSTSKYSDSSSADIYTIMHPFADGGQTYQITTWGYDECEAGRLCNFNVVFRSTMPEDEDPDPDYTYWTCTMQPTQINVLAYCSNMAASGASATAPGANGGTYASRIQTWWNQPTDTSLLKPSYRFQSVLGTNKIEQLNDAEIEIAKRLEAGMNPLRHYPVLRKTQVYSARPKIDFDLIDHIASENDINKDVSNEDKNPYKLTGWQWLCTGITSEYNPNQKLTKVTTEFTGSRSASADAEPWDVHFYGEGQDRWQFGGVYNA